MPKKRSKIFPLFSHIFKMLKVFVTVTFFFLKWGNKSRLENLILVTLKNFVGSKVKVARLFCFSFLLLLIKIVFYFVFFLEISFLFLAIIFLFLFFEIIFLFLFLEIASILLCSSISICFLHCYFSAFFLPVPTAVVEFCFPVLILILPEVFVAELQVLATANQYELQEQNREDGSRISSSTKHLIRIFLISCFKIEG